MTGFYRHLLLLVAASFFALGEPLYALSSETNLQNNISDDNIKSLPMIKEQSVSTFLPSGAAPGRGLAINIIYPKTPRYKNAAPIVVVIPGGDSANGLNFCLHAAQVGCVEVRFAFPGGGTNNFRSSGFNDYRGITSQRALRDILLFAAGKTSDFRNHTISELLPIPLDFSNIGAVAWSNGGNITLVTMEKYSRQLSFINWLVLYECPLGSLFFPPSLGSIDSFLLNNHYRQGSAATGHCLIDFRKLAWQADAKQNPGLDKKLGEADLPGAVYFDDNQNNKWDESAEFAFNYCHDRGLKKKFYPPDVTAALERLKIFDKAAAAAPLLALLDLKQAGNVIPTNTSQTSTNQTSNNSASPAQKTDKPTPSGSAKSGLKAKIISTLSQKQKAKTTPKVIEKKEPDTNEGSDLKSWPATVATLNETENYFQERDGLNSIPAICSLYPNLLITVFASQVDHLQTQSDHPHIICQYNAFIDNRAHWVRLNPESVYLAEVANMNKQNFVQNEPNAPINAENIADYLEPEEVFDDYVFIDLCVAELVDRKHANNLTSPLNSSLCHYVYGSGYPANSNKDNSLSKGKSTQNNNKDAETNNKASKPNK